MPSANNEEIERRLEELLTPAVFDQVAYYRQLKMRDTHPELALDGGVGAYDLWRQVPSVRELTRMLAREDLLWCRRSK